jgi:molybdopterin molybdotransferase
VDVCRKPRVAFAGTGDELSRPGEPRKPGGIVASSGYGLRALIESWGGEARDLGILPDNVDAIGALPSLAADADLIITMGGASVGDHDLVKSALAPKGFVLDFWKIAMRPGKPLIFGRLGATPFIGLPGNPVSTLVCAMLFVRPAIETMLGVREDRPLVAAKTVGALAANDSRQDYLRAHLLVRDGELWADAVALQDSSMLSALAKADGLIVRAPSAPGVQPGERVFVLKLDGA